ncbi:MAG: hypothetical protein M3Y49_06480 [Actinomycetota bacterium]|nr:hypothetical protein [Actinomycetota bacterium]
MAQNYGGFDARNAAPPPTRGWWPLAIGLVCMFILAPAAFGVGIWLGVHRGMDTFQTGDWTASSPQSLDASTAYVVFASGDISGQSQIRCGATDPAGTFIPFTFSSGSVSINQQTEQATFTTTAAGSYTLECGDVTLRAISQAQMNNLGKDIGVPLIVGIGIAVVLGVLGLILTIVAIVRLVSSSNRRKQWQQSQQWQVGGQQQWGPGPR